MVKRTKQIGRGGLQFDYFRGLDRILTPPPHPTEASPGTEDKIREMQWRYNHGYELFHPMDKDILDEEIKL